MSLAFPAVHPPQPPMMMWQPASFHPKLSPIDSPQLPSPLSPFPFNESTPIVSRNHVCSPVLSPVSSSAKTVNATQAKRTRRKPCLNCAACRRSENCGRCAVCTNPNATNSICKQRKCEELRKRPSQLGATATALQRPPLNGPMDQSDDSNDTTMFNVLTPHRQSTDELTPLSVKTDISLSFPNGVHLPERKKRKTSTHQAKVQVKTIPPCGCPGSDSGNFYTHLGAADSPEQLRKLMEERLKVSGEALRMLEITYTGIEAKTAEGCPTAEWIVRRRAKEEKFTVLFRHHRGHTCGEQYTVVSCVFWDAIQHQQASYIYHRLTDVLPKYGIPTSRQCEYNNSKTCTCQGLNRDFGGASYSFGCSWSVYYNGCKFARSKIPRKFRLSVTEKEEDLDKDIQTLATQMAPVYKWLAPKAYRNQVETQESGQECRLGYGEERPFSGMTCCMDFCAHSHYDRHNMPNGGATVVVTMLKEGIYGAEASNGVEQLHVLPLYRLKDPPKTSIPGIEVRPVEASAESSNTGTTTPASTIGVMQNHSLPQANAFVPNAPPRYADTPLSSIPPSSTLLTGNPTLGSGGVPLPNRLSGSTSRPISAILPATCLSSVVAPVGSHAVLSPLSTAQRPLLADASSHAPLLPSPSPVFSGQALSLPLPSPSASTSVSIPTSGHPPLSNTSFSRTSSGEMVMFNSDVKLADNKVKIESIDASEATHPPLASPIKLNQFSILNLLSQPNSTHSPTEALNHSQTKRDSQATIPSTSAQLLNGAHINGVTIATPGEDQLLSASSKLIHGSFPHKNGFTINGMSQHSAAGSGVHSTAPLAVHDGNGNSGESDSDCCVLTDSPDPSPPASAQISASTTLHSKQEPVTSQAYQLMQLNKLPTPGSLSHPLNGLTRLQFPSSEGIVSPVSRIPNSLPTSSAQVPQPLPVTPSPLEQPKEVGRPYNDRIDAIPGGVAIALGHGSVLIECAKKELHATTPVWKPCKSQPTRVSMVFYQHKRLTRRFHGWYEEEEKQRQRSEEAFKRKMSEGEQLTPQMTLFNQRQPPIAGKILSPLSVNIPPTFRPSFQDDLMEEDEDDVLSDCSDTIESMLHPYSMLEESDIDEDEMDEDNDDIVRGRGIVPRATPLTDLECPFFLELPIKQIDQERPCIAFKNYPCPLVSQTTHNTTTLSFSSCKQQDFFSGNFVELP